VTPADGDIDIRHELKPGDLGMVVHLHGVLYAREYGLDTTFETYVAKPLAEFAMQGGGRLWIAAKGDRVVGSIAMVDAADSQGQLRWFLVVPEVRGTGLGRRLLELALDYARERGFARVFLWTFADLAAALKLYERAGFTVTETKRGRVWGAERTEVRMALPLPITSMGADAGTERALGRPSP
jgi:GNAT superfamily N-acetyltransferase